MPLLTNPGGGGNSSGAIRQLCHSFFMVVSLSERTEWFPILAEVELGANKRNHSSWNGGLCWRAALFPLPPLNGWMPPPTSTSGKVFFCCLSRGGWRFMHFHPQKPKSVKSWQKVCCCSQRWVCLKQGRVRSPPSPGKEPPALSSWSRQASFCPIMPCVQPGARKYCDKLT